MVSDYRRGLAKKKLSLNRGGLLKCMTIGT